MRYDFDKIISREGTCCEKYDRRKEIFGREDVIPLWIADMDFEVPAFIREAVMRRAEHPVYGYGFRDEGYQQAIVEWVARRNHWTIQPEWLDFTPGVVAGFSFGLRALSAPGDKVVIQPPVYPPFARMILNNGRTLVNNPLRMDERGHFVVDFEDLDRKLEGAKILLFCNPHNPTGRVFTREELMRIGELCIRHDVCILSDEIHSDLIQKPYHHLHIASLSPELAERTITLIAPSKTFNIAGLSTSVAIVPGKEVRERFRAEMDKLHVDQGNIFGKVALETAYRYGDEWLEQMLDYVGENMDYVVRFLDEKLPSVKSYKSEGTYLMWLDFSSWGMTCEELMRFLVNEAHLGFNEGRLFGEEGKCHMRMNVAAPRSVIRESLERLAAAASRLNL